MHDPPMHPRPEAAVRRQGVRPPDPLTVDVIVSTAMRLIDERGTERFSLRSLAAELGVYPTAVSWHVGNRARLLGSVSSAWMRDALPPPQGREWSEWLRDVGHAYRSAALDHPNLARLVASELVDDASGFALPDAVVGQLESSGIPDDELVHAYNAVVGATVGFVGIELARDPARTDEDRDALRRAVLSVDAGAYPSLSRHLDTFADRAFRLRWSSGVDSPLDESFAYLVELIIAGLLSRRRPD